MQGLTDGWTYRQTDVPKKTRELDAQRQYEVVGPLALLIIIFMDKDWLKASKTWLEASEAKLKASETWLEAPQGLAGGSIKLGWRPGRLGC